MAVEWCDQGVILSSQSYGESKLLLNVFLQNKGRARGMIRKTKKNMGILQVGNVVSVHWKARLEGQLGNFNIELLEAPPARFFHKVLHLHVLNWLSFLLNQSLPELHEYQKLYISFHHFLTSLHTYNANTLQKELLSFEMYCLENLGFGFDWQQCAMCGVREHLIYLSPKSGAAACECCGKPYHDRLLYLQDINAPQSQIMLDNKQKFIRAFLPLILPNASKLESAQRLRSLCFQGVM